MSERKNPTLSTSCRFHFWFFAYLFFRILIQIDEPLLDLGFHDIRRYSWVGIEAECDSELAGLFIETIDEDLGIFLIDDEIEAIHLLCGNLQYLINIFSQIYGHVHIQLEDGLQTIGFDIWSDELGIWNHNPSEIEWSDDRILHIDLLYPSQYLFPVYLYGNDAAWLIFFRGEDHDTWDQVGQRLSECESHSDRDTSEDQSYIDADNAETHKERKHRQCVENDITDKRGDVLHLLIPFEDKVSRDLIPDRCSDDPGNRQ